MSKKIYSDLDMQSVSKITNLPAPASANEPARLADIQSAIEGIAWKDSVRVSTQGNLNLAAPGATIDGITMVSGDRFLARSQSTASQNGIYVWNGSATPATRSLDASTFAELEGAVTTVEEGTDAGATFRQTQVNGTIDSSTVTWTAFGTSAPAASETTAGIAEIATQAETDAGTDDARFITPLKFKTSSLRIRKHTATIGDGSATQIDVTHNFNTTDVIVEVYEASGGATVLCDVSRNSVNVVRLNFTAAPASNALKVVILG